MQATLHIKGYDGIERMALGKRTAVYSVRKSRYKTPVVLSVLLPHLMGERRFLTRFEKSVRLALGIKHANIVNILDYGRVDNAVYMVTQRYDGTPLQEILSEQHRVPVDIALCIVLQVARALEAAHAVGLVHRDVRPANIILTDDGVVKLSGFAMATDIAVDGRVTHAGKVTATPAYMSPEQTRGDTLTSQSDIFSLGAVAYELLTGRRAFGSGDFGHIIEHVQNSVLPAVESINPLVEAPVERLVATMLQKDTAKRYLHVSELLMDLEEVIEKYALHADAGNVAAFALDPPAFFDEYAHRTIERLIARAPLRDGARAASRANLVRYYRKLVYLDPHDQGAKKELAELQRGAKSDTRRGARHDGPGADEIAAMRGARYAALDPDALYRVVLESIDTTRDNEASFALKLSMKLRSPLPRVQSLVRKMPARVSDRMAYRPAMRLARIIEELGGHARLDVCPDQPSGTSAPSEPQAPANSTRTCPKCGWVDEGDAEYCEVCLHRFAGSAPVTFEQLRDALPDENPLAETPVHQNALVSWWGAFMALPVRTRVIAVLVAVVFVALIALTR